MESGVGFDLGSRFGFECSAAAEASGLGAEVVINVKTVGEQATLTFYAMFMSIGVRLSLLEPMPSELELSVPEAVSPEWKKLLDDDVPAEVDEARKIGAQAIALLAEKTGDKIAEALKLKKREMDMRRRSSSGRTSTTSWAKQGSSAPRILYLVFF